MPVIARPAGHHIHAVDLFREEHAVAVERQERVFQLVEAFEILRPRHADGRAVIAVAPGDVIRVSNGRNARVVAEFVRRNFRISALKTDRLVANEPMNAVVAVSGEKIHADRTAVAAENAGEAVSERHDRAVKHAVRDLIAIAPNYRVSRITPHRFARSRRFIFPGDIWQSCADNSCHIAYTRFQFIFRCPWKSDPFLSGTYKGPAPRGMQSGLFRPARSGTRAKVLTERPGNYLPRNASICACASATISSKPSARISSYMSFTPCSGSMVPVSSSG